MDIVIYTDDQPIFEKHLKGVPLLFEPLSKEQLSDYTKYNFVHRAKICVIQDCMKKYGSNVLYVDGDTYFLQSPLPLIQKISKEYSVFHQFEFTIADGGDIHEVPMWLTLRRLAKRYEYTLKGETFKLSFDSQMWNSGVLGLTKEFYPLIEDVLDLNDQLTAREKFKTAEQFSFAFVLSKQSTLIAADLYIYHYWQAGLKNIYNYHIDKLLNTIVGDSLQLKAQKAVELNKKQSELTLPDKTFLERVKLRCDLIWQVAKNGHY